MVQKGIDVGIAARIGGKASHRILVLLEDCAIPLFLRDKKYADFRTDFESGLKDLLSATAGVTSDALGRKSDDLFYHDWAIDWDANPLRVILNLTCASFYKQLPFSVLTQIEIRGEETAAEKFRAYDAHGLGSIGRAVILTSCVEYRDPDKLQLLICDNDVATRKFGIKDIKSSLQYDVAVQCRRLGDDSGKGCSL